MSLSINDECNNRDNLELEERLQSKFGKKNLDEAKERAQFKMKVASAMRERRIYLHMDQSELAGLIRTSQQQLSRYEVGTNSPTVERLYDLCKVMGLELILRDKEKGTELVRT
jgi:DNA-binding XRE family transcriptional regulator